MARPYRFYNIKTSRKELLKENASKYLFFAWTLNRLKEFLLCQDAKRINEGYITKSIHKTELLKGFKEPDKLVDKWLADMEFIGLIRGEYDPRIDQHLIYITEKGIEEYKNQTYNVLAANLLEAQESRRLSRIAIIIAVVSVIVAIGIVSICCK
ncbi:MAG: hypothetical protein IJR26_07345 [Bacteroidales bacterium]|nr:hypothetical protein [Bacteroidales bacterium]